VDRRLFGLLATSTIISCHPNVYVSDVPAEIERIVVVKQSKGGKVISTSPFRRYSADAPRALAFELGSGWDVLDILGFDAAAVAMLEPLPDDVETIALGPANGCAPRLPPPAWVETLDPSGRRTSTSTAPPALTASWLTGRCPNVQDRIDADAPCIQVSCPAQRTQTGCTLTIDLRDCKVGRYTFQIDYDGGFCPDTVDPTCTLVSQADAHHAAVHCSAPSIECDVAFTGDAPPPLLRTSTITVVAGVPFRTPNGPPTDLLRNLYRISGWFTDFAVLADRVAVSIQGGAYLETRECTSTVPSRISVYDATSLAHIATSTAPPCLMRLIEHPKPGFLGVYGKNTVWTLGQFTDTGALTSGIPLALDAKNGRRYFALDGLYAAATDEVILAFAYDDQSGAGHTIVAIRPSTGTETVLEDEPTTIDGLAVSEDGLLAYDVESGSRGVADSVRLFDLHLGKESGDSVTPTLNANSNQHLLFHPESSGLVISSPGSDPAIFLLRDGKFVGNAGRRLPLTVDYGPYSSAVHPGDPHLVLVGAASLDPTAPRRSLFAIYDPHQHVFQPGVLHAGSGPPTRMRSGLGAVWVAFPWEAKLVKVVTP
jgi:hypothetical protein